MQTQANRKEPRAKTQRTPRRTKSQKETADTLAPAQAGVYADEHGPRPAAGISAFIALRIPAGRS